MMAALRRGDPPERAAYAQPESRPRPEITGRQGTPARPQLPGRPAGRSPQRALLSRLGRHRAAAALLSAGLALRILVLAAYRPALFFTDSPRYLYDAQGNDPAGYRLPLRAIVLAGNLQAVAIVQHLLGLAMAVTLYLLLTRHGAPRWLAAIATAPVLLDAYQLQLEQTIMPDVWLEALIVAGLAVLLWKPRLSTGTCILAGLIFGSSATVRQVGEILIIPALIFVLAAAGGGWRQLARKTIALTAAFAAPILFYCAASYDLTGHFWLAHTGVTTSYGRMAAAADCAALKLPPRERALCPTAAQRALGPDGLEHSAQSPLRPYYARLGGGASAVVSAFNAAVLRQQPGRVLAAAAADAVKLFAVSRRTRPGDTPISRWQFQPRYPASPPHATSTDIQKIVRQFGGGPPAVSRPAAQFLRAYQLDGGYTPGPLLLACAAAGLAGSLAAVRRRAGPAARQLARGCLLFSAAAAAVLVLSDAFQFSWRYQLPALVTLPPAAALALSLLRRGARPQQAGPAGGPQRAGP